MRYESSLAEIPDDELLRRLTELLAQSRRVEADLVAHIGEVDERGLYARHASPSMFAYCTDVLHLSGAEAYLRIAAARATRELPVLLDMLGDGRLHLFGIATLVPYLNNENATCLLGRAAHKSKRQLKELLAEIAPRPDAPAMIRKLPERSVARLDLRSAPATPSPAAPAPARSSPEIPPTAPELRLDAPASIPELRPDGVASTIPLTPAPVIEPLAPARYRVQFTASAELRFKLERLQALMRSQVPDGDLAAVIEHAVTEKLERLEARRFGTTKAPRKELSGTRTGTASRYVSAAVRRAVHARDGGQCCYVDPEGRRCPERHRLEYHHRHPYGRGGKTSVRNVCLLCPTHNRYMAELDYGRDVMARHRNAARPQAVVRPGTVRRGTVLRPGTVLRDGTGPGRQNAVRHLNGARPTSAKGSA